MIPMTPCQPKPLFVLLSLVILIISGCNNSDSTKNEHVQKKAPSLVGTWQHTAIGKKEVSNYGAKIIFSESTLTMDAPGCMIIGDYTIDKAVLTYTITAFQGERCATDQAIGISSSVYYTVTDSQLTLTPLLAGEENQLVYKRIKDKKQ